MFLHDIYLSHRGCEPDNSTQISCSGRKKKDNLSKSKELRELYFSWLMQPSDNPILEIKAQKSLNKSKQRKQLTLT